MPPIDADEVHRAVAGDPDAGVGVAINPDVVGRIEESGVDRSAVADHRLQEAEIPSVAAADPVLAEDPDVAGPGARRHRHRRDHLVLGISRTLQDHVDLAGGEAGQREVEADVEHRQLSELELQQLEVLAGAECDPVVGEPERALLRFREVRQHDRRHLRHPSAFAASSRPCPAMIAPSESTRIGLAKPNARIEAAICSSWRLEWVRALRGLGTRLLTGR